MQNELNINEICVNLKPVTKALMDESAAAVELELRSNTSMFVCPKIQAA